MPEADSTADDTAAGSPPASRARVLVASTIAFTLAFGVWLMFGVLGIPIRDELLLTEVEYAWLAAIPVLNGSVWRLPAGVLAERVGGRIVFVVTLVAVSVPTYLASLATSYVELVVCAFFIGFAGNLFSVGVAWNSAWYPPERKGFALGVFGAGNVGASMTKFIGPALMAAVPAGGLLGGWFPGGWRFVAVLYALMMLGSAALVWFIAPSTDRRPAGGRPLVEMLSPLKQVRVWRFGLYYFVVFGAYVALSIWLPKYYVDVYGLSLSTAALLTAAFIFPASLLRPLGGWASDRWGPRRVMYGVLGGMSFCLLLLSGPSGHIVLSVPARFDADGVREVLPFSMPLWGFFVLVFLVGVAMGIGKAGVYKYIPQYFPRDVGAVGGLVGMIGALGGFVLPPVFGYALQLTWVPQSAFFVVFGITLLSVLWLHHAVMNMFNRMAPELRDEFDLPDAPRATPRHPSKDLPPSPGPRTTPLL